MGRLKHIDKRRLYRASRGWLLPVGLTLTILFGLHATVTADPAPSSAELQQYLQTNQLDIFSEIADEYPQIFYRYDNRVIPLTTDPHPHLHPVASGQYVTWLSVVNGQSQVFLYDVLAGSQLQLSLVSPNEGVYIHNNQVVWQGWDGDYWQIYHYDGIDVEQITTGNTSSVHAITDGQQVVYAEQIATDVWRAQSYEIASGQVTTIREGDTASTAYPRFDGDGAITTAFIPY